MCNLLLFTTVLKITCGNIRGLYGGEDSSRSLLGCDVVWCCGKETDVSYGEDGCSEVVRNVLTLQQYYMVSQARTRLVICGDIKIPPINEFGD